MKSLSIRAKIIGSFSLVILISLITAVTSYVKLQSVENDVTNIKNTSFPAYRISAQLYENITEIQQNDTDWALTGNTKDDKPASDDFQTAFTDEVAQYKKLVPSSATALDTLTTDYKGLNTKGIYMAQNWVGEPDSQTLMDDFDKTSNAVRTDVTNILSSTDKLVQNALEQNASDASTLRTIVLLMSLLSLVISIVAGLVITGAISKPINLLISEIQNIAQGDGDLTKRMEITSNDELGTLALWFNKFVDNIEKLIMQVNSSVASISATSQQLASSTQQVNSATQQVSSAVQEVASGSENLAQKTMDVSNDTKALTTESEKGSASAKEAGTKMKTLAQAVEASSSAVSSLGSKSQEIVGIVDTINNIASQTNLLALNAAIEAARAGEAGRGFSVVADEVRKLAEESQQATKNIEALISEMKSSTDLAVSSMEGGRREVEKGSKVVEEALNSLEEIGKKVGSIEASVDTLSAVAQQSASSSQQMSAGVQQTSSSMEQVASAAQQLAATAQELQSLVGHFKVSEVLKQSHPTPQAAPSRPVVPTHITTNTAAKADGIVPASVMEKIIATRDNEEKGN